MTLYKSYYLQICRLFGCNAAPTIVNKLLLTVGIYKKNIYFPIYFKLKINTNLDSKLNGKEIDSKYSIPFLSIGFRIHIIMPV